MKTLIQTACVAALLLAGVGCAGDKQASQTGNNPATASAGSTSGSGSHAAKTEQAHHKMKSM